MFNITKNEFLNTGKVWYEDEYKNRLFVKTDRKNNCFTVKFRPADVSYSAEPIEIKFPLTQNGTHLQLTGPESYPESVKSGIEGLTEKISDWIFIFESLANLSIPDNVLLNVFFKKEERETYSDAELLNTVNKALLDDLADFEELSGIVNSVL